MEFLRQAASLHRLEQKEDDSVHNWLRDSKYSIIGGDEVWSAENTGPPRTLHTPITSTRDRNLHRGYPERA